MQQIWQDYFLNFLNTHKLDADTRKDPIMDAELYIEIREVFIIGS